MDPQHKKYILEHIHDTPIEKIAKFLGLKEKKVKKFLEKEKQKGKSSSVVLQDKNKTRRRSMVLSLFLIAALGLLVYSNSLKGQFIWDDESLVRDNIYVKNWSHHLGDIFTSSVGRGAGEGEKFTAYRPLQILTYAFDYHFWKLNPVGYHLTNILLHVGAAFCVFWLILLIFKNLQLSLATALLFVVHPVHAGAVSYISGRADPLALIFLLLTYIFYLKHMKTNNVVFYIFMNAAYAGSFLSRETSLILPVLILLYHGLFRQRVVAKSIFSLCALTVVYVILRLTLLRSFLHDDSYATYLWQRAPGVFIAITHYARLLLLPFHLHVEYGQRLFSFSDPGFIFGMVLAMGLIVCSWWQRQRNMLLSFAIAWFFIAFLPVSNIFPLNAYMAEHWLYMPSIGFFLALAQLFRFGFERQKFRVATICGFVCLVAFYAILTIRQNTYWRQPQSFFERTLVYAPDSPRMLRNLAQIYKDQGRYQDAVALYRRALAVTPDDPGLYIELGGVYEKMGRPNEWGPCYKKAIELYEKNLSLGSVSAIAYNNLGFAYEKTGESRRAQEAFEKAVQLEPDYADAYNNLGAISQNAKTPDEILEFYQKTVGLDPDTPEACYSLGFAYQKKGRLEDAQKFYEKAVALNPDYTQAYASLGGLYQEMGRFSEAVAIYKRAQSLKPRDENIAFNLGLAYQKMGRSEEALISYRQASSLNPSNAFVYANMGAVYFATHRFEEAVSSWKEAIRLNPEYAEVYVNLGLAYQDLSRNDEARASFLEAIRANPHYSQAYNYLAVVYMSLGKKPEAMAALEKAIAVDPSFSLAYQNLATMYYYEKRYQDAFRVYREGVAHGVVFEPSLLKSLESLEGKSGKA